MANEPEDKERPAKEDSGVVRLKTSPGLRAVEQVSPKSLVDGFDTPNKTLRMRIARRPARERTATGSLLVVSGTPSDIGRHVLIDGTIVVGRVSEGLRLRDGNISRRHAQVTRDGNYFLLSDLGSTNGTLLNGKQINRPERLSDGDTIVFGQTVVKFHVVADTDRRMDEPPWIVFVVDEAESAHQAATEAITGSEFCGRKVELVNAYSSDEALEAAEELDATRMAVALIDAGDPPKLAGLALASRLREQYGNGLQIVLYSDRPEEIAPQNSHYMPKAELTPLKLRALLDISIRNFRSLTAMSVLCDTLSQFAALFESACDNLTLNQLLQQALKQYSSFWAFDYHVIHNLEQTGKQQTATNSWQKAVYEELRSLDARAYRSAEFTKLILPDEGETWACVIKPLGGRFTAGFAIRVQQTPPAYMLADLQTVMRAWALARTSLQVRQIIMDEQSIRREMDKERREGIAQMVAGVAHEVNTPLGIAKTAAGNIAQLIESRGDSGEAFHEEYEDLQQSARLIMRSISRAGELIQNFRRLSVGQLVDVLEDLDVVKTVEGVAQLYASQSKTGVEVVVHDHTEPGSRTWSGYAGYLSQVTMNLLTNSERYGYPPEAHEDIKAREGRLTVDITISSRMVGDLPEFAIAFTDYGVGIPKHRLAMIFDPFFTTGRGRGATGLGLSIVYNIVTNIFSGSVSCQSTPGHGTTFFMTFSHCEPERNMHASVQGFGEENISIFQDFIRLQRKYIQQGRLEPDEQLRWEDSAGAMERYLKARFKGRHQGRRHPRIPTRRAMHIYHQGTWHRSELRDISEGGALHVLRHGLEPGSRILVRYWKDPDLVVRAEVVAATEIKSLGEVGKEWQTGIKFIDVTEDIRRLLKLLIAEVMLEYWG